MQCDMQFIDDIKKDFQSTSISEKLKSILSIVKSVQESGKEVTARQIEEVRKQGATDGKYMLPF